MPSLTLTLPYPPSVNTYWGFQGHRRFLTLKAKQFKDMVAYQVSLTNVRFTNKRLEIIVALHAPDKRVRDIDNVLKPLLDSLVQAGLFIDDSQVDYLTVIRKDYFAGGKSIVVIKSD